VNLAGAHVVITGAARGIGFATAEALLAAGAIPVLLDKDQDALQQAAARLNCPHFSVDVTNADDVDATAASICERYGVPQGVVNNAGILRSAPLVNIASRDDGRHSLDLWQSVIDTNLTSVFLVSRAFADRMVRGRVRGVIVNMSSVSARGNMGQCAYAAAKAGVEAMTRVWAKELGPLGLRCVAVAPGFVDTPSTRDAVPENVLEVLRRETPLRKLGKPEQVAQTILFALTNDMITGATIPVDGGLVI
jgi:3-oxoacyl-[acyl-carrier protein] reductase